MKLLLAAIACLIFSAGTAIAQKGTAERPDYYPSGYTFDTWTGEVTAFDNDHRTLTLTYTRDKKKTTFVASVPDAPYQWGRDARNFRVIDFPFDKKTKSQLFVYVGVPGVSYVPPDQVISSKPLRETRPNPPAENVIADFSEFVGRNITVYYMTRERIVDGKKEEYNDVWRIRVGKKS